MTREQKLALIVGFSLILLVGVLISDHLSRARAVQVAGLEAEDQNLAAATQPNLPDAVHAAVKDEPRGSSEPQPVTGPAMGPIPGSTLASGEPVGLGQPADYPGQTGTLIAMGPATAAQSGQVSEPTPDLTEATRQLIEDFRDTAKNAVVESGLAGISLPPATNVERVSSPGEPVPPLADPAPPATATTWYTVKPGETLFQIAKRQYGKGSAWKELAELNKGRVSPDGAVRAGAKIEIFESLPGVNPAVPAPAAKPKEKAKQRPASKPAGEQRITEATPKKNPSITYTVRKGDSLGVISQKVLGTVKRKDEILDLNRSVVDDEDSIQVGMVLKMPAR